MSTEDWRIMKDAAPVRVQWDPERDLHHNPLDHRAIQIGLSGEAVRRYTQEWIKAISDITPLAHAIHARILGADIDGARAMLPAERPYTVTTQA